MVLRYDRRMLYLILGGLFVVALLVIILRKNSGEPQHHIHDEAMWSGHSDGVQDHAQSDQAAADHDVSSGDSGSGDSDSSSDSSSSSGD